jgi:NADPH-dependent glutamate synthase beta subunit-like oxidoreductase/glutamate synthase domain-containing protein 3/NAD-dependent dihydropyrimidine dehydrogenase PreA subunit
MPVKKKTARKRAPLKKAVLEGMEKGSRESSRELEERLQAAIEAGARTLAVKAKGQQGIGGRIWPRPEKVKITVEGTSGQRLGSMGFHGTEILVKGSASDDVGWINCGAEITVLGDVTNGAHNAAAQGKLYVAGGGGARCDTMTKHNPRFEPPESWYLRDVGDSFAEFKAGGVAVVCGVDPRNPDNVLGYRPCVGMVGGTIYFRGPHQGFSQVDVKLLELTPQDWQWLTRNMKTFLGKIKRTEILGELTRDIGDWSKLVAYTPAERAERARRRKPMQEFHERAWEEAVGSGGIFGPYITHDRSSIPYVPTGEDRRLRPEWANDKYLPPCAYSCPTRIPSHRRATMIRQGRIREALEMVLEYSPLPATVCGEVCPNLCMSACTRGRVDRPLNIKEYGRAALELKAPEPAKKTGNSIGIIGAGPAGLSAAWQLALKGHSVRLYESAEKMGGKVEMAIPRDRLPQEILGKELSRFREVGVDLHLGMKVDRKAFGAIKKENDFVVVACGAHQPRIIRFKGSKDVIPAIEFLKQVNYGERPDLGGKRVAIIGAGNVGMDVALQAWNSGAESVTAVDVQKPAAFGVEMEMAMERGTEIIWPKFTESFDKKSGKLHFGDGSSIDADVALMSVGEIPVLDFLPESIHTERGWIRVNERYQTSDQSVYAIGDAVRPGLITHAIGQGRVVADILHAELSQYDYVPEPEMVIPYDRVKGEYYDMCRVSAFSPREEASACMSCGSCRDCHLCEQTCYQGAISRRELEGGGYEYVVDAGKCIGCGFCAGVCPCGVWEMAENY